MTKKSRINTIIIIVVVFALTIIAYPLIFTPRQDSPVLDEEPNIEMPQESAP